jgi:hypothetical protein
MALTLARQMPPRPETTGTVLISKYVRFLAI